MRALLVIADIGGYTNFMKLHRMSLAHAQENTDRLLHAVIDAAPRLRLVDLEGDAAFFYVAEPQDEEVATTIAGLAAVMHRAFHDRQERIDAISVCRCDACEQIGNLRVKFVSHIGDVVVQSGRRSTKVAGVDVIVVHRMLKNDVPLSEYLLVTQPIYDMLEAPLKAAAAPIALDLEGLGRTDAYYVDLAVCSAAIPAVPVRPWHERLARHARLTWRSLPYVLGRKKACIDFRNVPQT